MNYISFKYNKGGHIFLWKIKDDINESEEVIIDEEEFRFLITYPLRLPKLYIYSKPNGGWTRNDVLQLISRTYKNIYKEEIKTSTNMPIDRRLSDIALSPRNSLIDKNRPETNGIHGIYSHNLTELYITEMIYNFKKDRWEICVKGDEK